MAGRDEAEFEAYVISDSGRLLGFALLLAGSYQDAEDLVQTALLRSAGRWVTARHNPQAYTRTVLVNLARDRWRARRYRQRETLIADAARLPVATARDGAAAVLDREALLRACRVLPAAQRAVLVLRFWEDRSIDETAAVPGCSAGTVKSHTHRALRRLRAVLDDAPGSAMSPAGPALAPARRIDDVDRP
jgi:RNA polymerase sigma-70 factor (sigma-E family)